MACKKATQLTENESNDHRSLVHDGRAWFVPETSISNPDITSYSKSNNPGKIQENNQNSGSTERKETSDFVLIIHQYCILLKMIHRKKIQPSLLTISKMVQEVQHLSEQF